MVVVTRACFPRPRGPGRPPKAEGDKRSVQRIFSRREYERVKEAAAAEGKTAAAYVRDAVWRAIDG